MTPSEQDRLGDVEKSQQKGGSLQEEGGAENTETTDATLEHVDVSPKVVEDLLLSYYVALLLEAEVFDPEIVKQVEEGDAISLLKALKSQKEMLADLRRLPDELQRLFVQQLEAKLPMLSKDALSQPEKTEEGT